MVNFLNVKSETNSIDQDLSNVFKKGTLDFFNTTFNMLPPKSWLEINVSFNTRFDMVLEYIEVYVGDGSFATQPYAFEVYCDGIKIAERVGVNWAKSENTRIVPTNKSVKNGQLKIMIQNYDNRSYPLIIPHISFYGDNVIQEGYLLQSNNKTYSLESLYTKYETKMTSNTAPAPFVASASSIYSTSYPAWRAFASSNPTGAFWSTSAYQKGWIQIDYGTLKK